MRKITRSSNVIGFFVLVDHKTVLLISMTGHHQIWAYAFEETQWWNDVYVFLFEFIPTNSSFSIES
jgi:hypothetical protein